MTSRNMQDPSFAALLWRAGVVTFGDFVTKSGRHTPYFVDAGRLSSGTLLAQTGLWYADAIATTHADGVDVIFGPAYKGIPLAVTTAIALAENHGIDVGVSFDRKEVKDHGEGGALVGSVPGQGDRVVLVEDVTTAGTSVRNVAPLLEATGAHLVGLVVGVDRQERGPDADTPALAHLADEFAITTTALSTIDGVLEHVGDGLAPEVRTRVEEYRRRYGV